VKVITYSLVYWFKEVVTERRFRLAGHVLRPLTVAMTWLL